MIVVVLNDGETYSDASGCKIVEVNDAIDSEDIEEALKTLRDQGDAPGVRVLARLS